MCGTCPCCGPSMYPPCRHIFMLPRTKDIYTICYSIKQTCPHVPHSASTAPAGHNRPPDPSSKPRELAGRQCTMPLRYSAIRITRRGDCLWLHLTRRSSCWRRRASSASWTRTGLISFTRHPLPAHPILEAPVQALLAPPHHRRLADMRQRLYFDLDGGSPLANPPKPRPGNSAKSAPGKPAAAAPARKQRTGRGCVCRWVCIWP